MVDSMRRSDIKQLQRAANGVCHAIFRASNGEVRVTALMDMEIEKETVNENEKES